MTEHHDNSAPQPTSHESSEQSNRRRFQSNAEWLSMVREVQIGRLSPQDRREIQERAEASRRMLTYSVQTACVAQRGSEATYRASRAVSMPHKCEEELAVTSTREEEYQRVWNNPEALQLAMQANRSRDMDDRRSAHLFSANYPTQRPAPPTVGAPPEEEEASIDIDALLSRLRTEPSSDKESEEKFQLYEAYALTIETIRKALDEVAAKAATELPPAPREAVATLIRQLDSNENRGIYDQSRYWFVHDMAQRAAANGKKMIEMSREISRRISLCAGDQQPDCPICLEPFGSTAAKKTLSCCHSVCDECWTQWAELQGHHVFCPLCKNTEFMDFISRGM